MKLLTYKYQGTEIYVKYSKLGGRSPHGHKLVVVKIVNEGEIDHNKEIEISWQEYLRIGGEFQFKPMVG